MKPLIILVISLFSFQAFPCHSDFECGIGNVCVKPKDSYSLTGVCVTPVDEFGLKDYNPPMQQEFGPRDVDGCSFNSECPIGFKCLKEVGQLEGICVK